MSFSGKGDKLKKVDTLNSKQQELLKKYIRSINRDAFDLSENPTFQAGQSFITDMLNPSSDAYKKFEAPYLRQFQEQLVPQLTERYNAYDLQKSSGFDQALAHAYTGMQENLAAMKTQNMMAASQGALNYGMAPANLANSMVSQALGTPAYAYQNIQGQPGWGQGLMGGLGQGLGTVGGALIGSALGPVGTAAGGAIGGWLGGLFK